jgi:hypothetical protein
MLPHPLVHIYWLLGGTYCPPLQGKVKPVVDETDMAIGRRTARIALNGPTEGKNFELAYIRWQSPVLSLFNYTIYTAVLLQIRRPGLDSWHYHKKK